MSIKTCAATTCRTSLDENPVTCPHSLAFCADCTWEETCELCGFDAIAAAEKPAPTVTTYPNIGQRSEEWYEQRRGIVTASVVGNLITPTLKVANNDTSRGITANLVAERITGITEPSFITDDMFRGIEAEPVARDLYSGHYEQAVEVGFVKLEADDWTLGVSPDGLVGTEGGIEIKAPRAKGHILTILADEVPQQHMAQIQAALLVTGRKWWDFVSFHGGLPLYVKRVHPDPEWFTAIEEACRAFETKAAEMVADFQTRTARMPKTERFDPNRVEIKL